MEFLDPEIEQYALEHSEEESTILNELNRQTHLKILQPRMLSGHLQGRILSMLSQSIQPKTILEIGTYTGYSALCMAEGLQNDGVLYTIDINKELVLFAQKYFNKSSYKNLIKMMVGNALEIIPELNFKWDLVFIDADKENYSNYFDSVIEKVNKGGMIIADNVLWSGKVTRPTSENDIETKALKTFNEKVNSDSRVSNVLMPVRDGMMIMIKK
ncbi:MAG: Putative O-methyltransferase [Crocinitomicaceae bacterium]|nr:MAG: Putative O-methyltransferase [Crocinitomicaceae bacterium]